MDSRQRSQIRGEYPVGKAGTPTRPRLRVMVFLYSQAPAVRSVRLTKIYDGTVNLPTDAYYTIGSGINGESVAVNMRTDHGNFCQRKRRQRIGVTLGRRENRCQQERIPVLVMAVIAANVCLYGAI